MSVEENEKIERAHKLLESMTNAFGNREALGTLANRMTTMHRTLVQGFTGGFIVPFVRELAKMSRCGYVDGRNKAAAEACEVMCSALEQKYGITEDEELRFACV